MHTDSQKIHHFVTLPFLSILPPLLTPPSPQPFFFFFHSHPVAAFCSWNAGFCFQMHANVTPTHCLTLSHQMIRKGARLSVSGFRSLQAAWTYLSLQFQICFVSYEDHREFISVFYSKNLSLEFVDFFKAVKHVTWYYVAFGCIKQFL